MSTIHNAVVMLQFLDEDNRKFDIAVNNEIECEDQDYHLDDKIIKLGPKSDCVVELIQDN